MMREAHLRKYLEIIDKLGIVNIRPMSPYEVFRLEDHDPEQPKLVQFEVTPEDAKNTIQEILYFNI